MKCGVQIGGSHFFSSLYLRSGYNQIRIASGDTHKTFFRTRCGANEFLMVPFGLAGAPPNFQSLMDKVQRLYLDKFCLVYLDYILIYIRDKKEHIRLLSAKLPEHRFFVSREAW
jgi:hypothetical protein